MELRKGGDSFDWFFLAMAQRQRGDKDQAQKRFDQAVVWMTRTNQRMWNSAVSAPKSRNSWA
jgi:hypothetical protein